MRHFQKLVVLLMAAVILSGCALFQRPKIEWNDTRWCVPARLKVVLRQVSRKFGPVRVHSTHRWPLENKLKGGKPKSYHLSCRAVDFSVVGYPSGVTDFLKNNPRVGGYSYYPRGRFYHIDTGPKRTW